MRGIFFGSYGNKKKRFDEHKDKVTLQPIEKQNHVKPPAPQQNERKQSEEEKPKPSVGVKAPAKEKKEEKAACCRVF
jgi:hypothetical protein